jgi:very-short-patch-repair endonuclease
MSSDLELALAFQMAVHKIPAPVREHRFCPPRRFRFDFAWPEQKLAVEVDGGSWIAGRHNRGAGFAKDAEKANLAVLHGWRVLHFVGSQIDDGTAIDTIRQALGMEAA